MFLVIDHFISESQHILSELHSHPQSLFLFLKTAIDVHLLGTLDIFEHEADHMTNVSNGILDPPNELEAYIERLSKFPKHPNRNAIHITDELVEQYLEVRFSF